MERAEATMRKILSLNEGLLNQSLNEAACLLLISYIHGTHILNGFGRILYVYKESGQLKSRKVDGQDGASPTNLTDYLISA